MDVKQILLQNLKGERRITREAIAAMPDDKLAFRPTPEQMTFGAQALHIISCQETLMDAFEGKGWVWDRGLTLEAFPTAAAILARFDTMHEQEISYYEGLESAALLRPVSTSWGPPEPLFQLVLSFLTHEAHHRGQLVTYLRLQGQTPPRY